MIKFPIMVLFIHLSFISISVAQDGWYRQDSLAPIPNMLTGVSFVNVNTGFVAGNLGKVYKTTNGGQNWFSLNTNTTSNLYDIYMLNASTGFICGSSNALYRTTDGGISWNMMNISGLPSGYISSLKMSDGNTGYATAVLSSPLTAYILKTSDSGLNWFVSFSATTTSLQCLDFLNSTNTITGGSVFVRTINGTNWNVYASPITLVRGMVYLNSADVIGAGDYYRVSVNEPSIIKSTNGGNNFSINNYFIQDGKFNDVNFYDENNGFVVGGAGLITGTGIILRTTNKGITWIRQKNLYQLLFKVSFHGPNTATVVGGYGVIFNTTNGGWDMPAAATLISPTNGSVSVPLNTHMRWNKVDYNAAVYRVQVSTDPGFGSTVINAGSLDTTGFIIPNGVLTGNTTYYWRARPENPAFSGPWSSVWQFNTNLPLSPNLVSPSNNDTGITPNQTFDWTDVSGVSAYRCQISSDSVFSNLLIDSGSMVQSAFTPAYGELNSNTVYFWRANAINNSGQGPWSAIWKFTSSSKVPVLIAPVIGDTGVTGRPLFDWQDYSQAVSYRIQVSMNQNFTVFAVNSGGISQSQYLCPLNLNQNTVYYWRVNATHNTGISYWSNIWSFRTSVIANLEELSNSIPLENKLYGNYPNPFNPQTTFKFDIAEHSSVKLCIYDVLGNEVEIPLNSDLRPGTYQLNWNGSKLASGLYFFKLITGDYTMTKKMLLIK
jgi:photosystem II stability/assembly factor-like uncharacterized protein